jgi:predicted nucleic acid-binding protein
MLPRLYFDTNVFIVALESSGEQAHSIKAVFELVESGRAEAFTSEITLAEVLVGPYADGDAELASAYVAVLSNGDYFRLAPIDRETLVRAARLRAQKPSMKLPDAIHLATAELCDCGIVVSNDKGLAPRPPMTRADLSANDLNELIAFLA